MREGLSRWVHRIIPMVWLFQFALFGVGGSSFFLSPRVTLGTLRMGASTGFSPQSADPISLAANPELCAPLAGRGWVETFLWSWNCDADLVVSEVRFIGAYVFMAAVFSGLGLLFSGVRFRRGLAVALGTFIGLWSLAFIRSYLSGRYGLFALGAYGVPAFATTGLNWAYVAFARVGEREASMAEEVSGGQDDLPPWLWLGWILQGGLLLVLGGFRMLAPGHYLLFWLGREHYDQITPYVDLASDQVGIIASYTLGLGLMSFLALRGRRAWEWRTFARLFVVCQALLLVAGAVNVAQGYGTVLTTFPAWIGGAMMLMNLVAAVHRDPWNEDDAALDPQGWMFMDLVAGPMMWLQMRLQKRRASHLVGVGFRGHAELDPDPRVPSNSLFHGAQKSFEVVGRFANLTLLDDRGLDVRGGAIRLAYEGGPALDLLMNTGVMCPARHLVDFGSFVLSKWLPESIKKTIMLKDRAKREKGQAGLRYAPESYSLLRYHSQKVTHWVDLDDGLHLVRYRLRPAAELQESGLPPADVLAEPWKREARSAELNRIPRSDYLRQELRERLAQGPVQLVIEAQLHPARSTEGLELYDASVEWPENTHPWLRLARVTLTEVLPDADTEVLRFCPSHRPVSLPIPKASGPLDPRSLAYSEARVVRRLGRLRVQMTERSGLPSFGEVS